MTSPEASGLTEDPEIERRAERMRLAAGYREAARRALAFARRYREEEGASGGDRERACVAQALTWRDAIRDVLAGHEVDVAVAMRPGLARAGSASTSTARPASRSKRGAG